MAQTSRAFYLRLQRLSVGVLATLTAACASTSPPATTAPVSAAQPDRSFRPSSAASVAAASASAAGADASLDVWMFDVGQGSCVVIDCPDRERPILVDCGSTAPSLNHDNTVATGMASDLLAAIGQPAVVISHGDRDHYSLIPSVVAASDVAGVFIGGRRADYANPAANWLRDVERGGADVNTFGPSFFGADYRDLRCGSAKVDILIANATSGATKNGDSIVLAVTYGDLTVMLPGDAEGETEAQAIANKATIGRLDQTHTFVVGSHHGARTHDSNGAEWAEALSPVAVSFSQTMASFGHPQCEVVERYELYMPRWRGAYSLTCGVGSRITSTRVATRMLSTHDNGTMLLRVRPTRMMIYCEIRSIACSGDLPESTLS